MNENYLYKQLHIPYVQGLIKAHHEKTKQTEMVLREHKMAVEVEQYRNIHYVHTQGQSNPVNPVNPV